MLGAGVCGLATAMLLRRDGHDVTVLERDDEPVPESPKEAWQLWSRRGVTVTGLTTRAYDGTPHVTGLRTEPGDELGADLVVDAMGRRSKVPRWLSEAGVRPVHEEAEDCGFIYYTRFYRSSNGAAPQPRAPQLTPMGGVVDRYRRLVVDGRPVATRVVLVADAWACTNPSLGRGIALGLVHAQRLRDVTRSCLTPVRDTLAQPGVADRIAELGGDRERGPIPGPDREQLLELLS